MILPRGKSRWSNLNLSFVLIDELMRHLKKVEFTGCVHFIFKNSQGLVLFQEGDIVNGAAESDGERKRGQTVVDGIINTARENTNGQINVSEFSAETISILSEVFTLQVNFLYERLSAEFSNIVKFAETLQKDKFSGYMELTFPKDRRKGMEIIVFGEGKITALFTRNYQFRVNENNQNDLKHIQNYLKLAQDANVHYNVFSLVS